LSGPLKIVLVEDEAFQRQVVTEFLGKNGLRITALASGADLKRAALQTMPDLAILDVHLGEVEDGFTLARWLRARSSRVGIIMLTAASDTSTGWSVSNPVPMTTSPSRLSRANCSRGCARCCAAPATRRRHRPSWASAGSARRCWIWNGMC